MRNIIILEECGEKIFSFRGDSAAIKTAIKKELFLRLPLGTHKKISVFLVVGRSKKITCVSVV